MKKNKNKQQDVQAEKEHWKKINTKRYSKSKNLVIQSDRNYETYFQTRDYLRCIFEFFGDINGKNILDIGCGVGNLCVYFARSGAHVWGCDLSEENINIAKRFAKDNSVERDVTLDVMAAENLQYDDEFFNMIFGRSILHHTDVNKAAKEIYRVLKKGGKAAFVEPLAYHPVLFFYRRFHPRYSSNEMQFRYSDISRFVSIFQEVRCKEYRFLALFNEKRNLNKFLGNLDHLVLRVFPPLRKLCATIAIMLIK